MKTQQRTGKLCKEIVIGEVKESERTMRSKRRGGEGGGGEKHVAYGYSIADRTRSLIQRALEWNAQSLGSFPPYTGKMALAKLLNLSKPAK